jgi:hypothetical protein
MGDHDRVNGVVSAAPSERSEGVWFKAILRSRIPPRDLKDTVHDLPPVDRRDAVPMATEGDATIKQRSPFRVSTVKGMPPLTRPPGPIRARHGRHYAIVAVVVALASSAALWMFV